MGTRSKRITITGAWILSIALAFAIGRHLAPEAVPPTPDTTPPLFGRVPSPPSPQTASVPPASAVDVRPVKSAVTPLPPSPFQKTSELERLLTRYGEITADLGSEKRDQLLLHLADSLARVDPLLALEWAASVEDSEELRNRLTADILVNWSYRDSAAATEALESLEGPSTRLAAIEAMAESLARRGTESAVHWADSLTLPAEQDAAHAAIYDATPRGIGAMLKLNDGALVVDHLLPGGPAAQSGLIQSGDRILSIDSGDGNFHDLTDSNLGDAVNLVRGENGVPLRLQIERDTENGPQKIIVPLTRGQIIFPERGTRG